MIVALNLQTLLVKVRRVERIRPIASLWSPPHVVGCNHAGLTVGNVDESKADSMLDYPVGS